MSLEIKTNDVIKEEEIEESVGDQFSALKNNRDNNIVKSLKAISEELVAIAAAVKPS